MDLIAKIEAYFLCGAPIGELPWELIDEESLTPFQQKVYRATAEIPHGETRTYGWLAVKIGAPAATRAVGQSLRRNPIPILVPCHRVVSSHSIGGFMGEEDPTCREIGLKTRLLELEDRFRNPVFSFLRVAG